MNTYLDRRRFLELSTASATTAILAGFPAATLARRSAFRQINPSIPNTRVVCGHDKRMVKNEGATGTIHTQNDAIDDERVHLTMDNMALALAEKATPAEAWEAIFQKPASKEWSDLGVSIKINCQHEPTTAHAVIIGKVCEELIRLGVKTSNMRVYDGASNPMAASNIGNIFARYVGNQIPGGVSVISVNGTSDMSSPSGRCTNFIVDGSTDILVNIGNNKGHPLDWCGRVSLTLKNHYGTIGDAGGYHSEDGFWSVAKGDFALGGEVPRQQLNIMDSLWASKSTETSHGAWDICPARIIMGTMSAVLDYVTVRKIREELMNARVDGYPQDIINRMLGNFDISESDLEWIEVGGDEVPVAKRLLPGRPTVSLIVPALHGESVSFEIGRGMPYRIMIASADGRMVQSYQGIAYEQRNVVVWNGTDRRNREVSSGLYIVRCFAEGSSRAELLRLR
jgi:hypothetical protein